MAIVAVVQSIHYEAGCPYPAHLFIDVLAKVGYVKNATSIGNTVRTGDFRNWAAGLLFPFEHSLKSVLGSTATTTASWKRRHNSLSKGAPYGRFLLLLLEAWADST